MSASNLNLGQKEKGCEVLQKLKWVKQIMQSNSLKMMVSEMASLHWKCDWRNTNFNRHFACKLLAFALEKVGT